MIVSVFYFEGASRVKVGYLDKCQSTRRGDENSRAGEGQSGIYVGHQVLTVPAPSTRVISAASGCRYVIGHPRNQ